MEYLIIALGSYLLGSIPFGFILTKLFLRKDIRNIGSGNIGATNALRTGNKSLGLATLVLDISKAVLPVLYTKFYFSEWFDYVDEASEKWKLFHLNWLSYHPCVYVQIYEDLLTDMSRQMQKVSY